MEQATKLTASQKGQAMATEFGNSYKFSELVDLVTQYIELHPENVMTGWGLEVRNSPGLPAARLWIDTKEGRKYVNL